MEVGIDLNHSSLVDEGLAAGYYDYSTPHEPSGDEIDWWKRCGPDLSDKLAIRHDCPHCGSRNTLRKRHEWSMCFNCEVPFTLDTALDYQEFLIEEVNK